jgi:hypothetical protein
MTATIRTITIFSFHLVDRTIKGGGLMRTVKKKIKKKRQSQTIGNNRERLLVASFSE